MGLTIRYKLSLAKNHSPVAVHDMVERAAQYARKIGCAEVSKPLFPFQVPVFSELFVHVSKRCFGSVPARAGWLVEAWPGEGCESAHFGLCQYPRQAPYKLSHGQTGWVPTGYRRGWLFKGSCKTQYASEHGWEHFFRCHKMILSILKFWRQMGVTVEVSDEGGYWETGSEKKLHAALQSYNSLIAAMAGAFMDAGEASGKGRSVESPIFARNDFEQLEAKGWQEFGKRLSQLPACKLRP
jgi:hypothetical protein